MSPTVAVRALCEFTARTGDLDLRFSPSPTAQEGIAGHRAVVARRGAGWQAERPLEGVFEDVLTVRGRADGFDAAANLLEEIKTYRGDLARQPANQRALHWAQVKVYGALLCRSLNLVRVRLALVYHHIDEDRETVFEAVHDAADLQRFFDDQCRRYLHWARQEAAHRAARDAALAALGFPHGDFRAGQRQLATAVYRAARAGRCLLAQAPTGLGKTVGTLFPLLKACPGEKIDKVFFLTAKGSGRALALDALAVLRQGDPAPPLRVVELVARDKACEHPDKACHGESCPLARGFYDRLPDARRDALAAGGPLDRDALRAAALRHEVCPYHLGQELVRWADVAVGDYNHYFDASALLHALTVADGWRVAVLVDEAHNLVERARRMYSAELDQVRLRLLRRTAPAVVKAPLDRLHRAWNAVSRGQTEPYAVRDAVPDAFAAALRDAVGALGAHFADHPAGGDSDLLRFHFDALHFLRRLESFGEHSIFDVTLAGPSSNAGVTVHPADRLPAAAPGATPGAAGKMRQDDEPGSSEEAEGFVPIAATGDLFGASGRAASPDLPAEVAARVSASSTPRPRRSPTPASLLCLRNVVPAPFLAPRFAAARTTTLFSATLGPERFYRDTLGLPDDAGWIDVASPFAADQLSVRIARHISTRWQHRDASLGPIADLMAAQYAERPGNYLAFFSSFDYLDKAADRFAARHPQVPVWRQSRAMDDAGRDAFLARFDEGGRGIGFAVLGGAFGEGIDLPGSRLVGAFIATLGLPPLNPVNERMRERLEAAFGAGYDYAYLVPGMRKVVQAAGRVIRTPDDRGVVVLIDDRFARRDVRALLPGWWAVGPGTLFPP